MAPLGFGQDCSPAEALHISQDEPLHRARRVGSKRGFSVRFMATWNVRTLLHVNGYIETTKLDCKVSVADERKIDLVVSELEMYRVVMGALQETKWRGCQVCRIGESMVMTAGEKVPREGVVRQRG